MMFFQDTRSVGIVFWIVVFLLLIYAVILIIGALSEELVVTPEYVYDERRFGLAIGISSVVSAVIYGLNAHRMMCRKWSRIEVLRSYVLTVGLCTLIEGLGESVAVYFFTEEAEIALAMAVITAVLAFVIVLISMVIAKGKKGIVKMIIWAILVIAFVLMVLDSLTPAENYWEYASHIAHLLIGFFMLSLLLDRDVRTEMGVRA